MHNRLRELFPLCRSITGPGLRQTLEAIAAWIPLTRTEVPTGEAVLDWTIPREWRIRDAYVADQAGRRVIDFQASNLHVVNYSAPVRTRLSLPALKARVHTLPSQPDLVPYRTSYYREDWGFCAAQSVIDALPRGEYEAVIDSSFADGALSYGECVLPGASSREILFSAHCCHPSLANDNLSAIVVAVELARILSQGSRRYTYRFLFAPGTIGAIAWLARNRDRVAAINGGLVLTCLGDGSPFTYKLSRAGNTYFDTIARLLLSEAHPPAQVVEFSPYGYDERQFGSPGFHLPVGRLSRGVHGQFPEYHTSADTPDFVRPEYLAESLSRILGIVHCLENDAVWVNGKPFGEPQLGRRGCFQSSNQGVAPDTMAMLWVLNLSDGSRRLSEIAQQAKLSFETIHRAAVALGETDLLRRTNKEITP